MSRVGLSIIIRCVFADTLLARVPNDLGLGIALVRGCEESRIRYAWWIIATWGFGTILDLDNYWASLRHCWVRRRRRGHLAAEQRRVLSCLFIAMDCFVDSLSECCVNNCVDAEVNVGRIEKTRCGV